MMKVLRILIIILVTFFIIQPVNAQVNTQDRTTLDNLGVNKKWNIKGKEEIIKNTPKVDASEKIYDFSNVLTDEEKEILLEKINNYINKTGFDLVIVTYDLAYENDSENEDWASNFYDYNDFGLKYKNNSGTLLFRNTYVNDRYYDFYMFGNTQLYYQGNKRNDIILDGIYYDISNGYYLEGFTKYIDYLYDYYLEGPPKAMKNYKVDSSGYLYYEDSNGNKYYGTKDIYGNVHFEDGNKKFYINTDGEIVYDHTIRNNIIFSLIFGTMISLIVVIALIKKNKMVHKELFAYNYLERGSYRKTIDESKLINTKTVSHAFDTSSSGSFGGGGGGFSSGGGFRSSSGSSGGGHSSGGGRHG